MIEEKACINLLFGIVRIAIVDWKRAKRMLISNPDNEAAKELKKDCEDFFRGELYAEFRDYADGELPEDILEELE